MINRRAYTLIEAMMAIVFLELFVMHVPDVYRVVWKRERRADAALDRVALRTSVSRQLRADLDAARAAQVFAGGVVLDLADGPVTYATAPGGLIRVARDTRVFPLVALAKPPALDVNARGALLALDLTAPGGALVLSRLWGAR